MRSEPSIAGIFQKKELIKSPGWPSEERFGKGPVAVIECPEEIPCDNCVDACSRGAIKMDSLNGLPKLDADKCIGCRLCIPKCPGLAIFVLDMMYSEKEALVSFPYEFDPLPRVGSIVAAVDRKGNKITRGKVVLVSRSARFDHTNIVSIAVPKKYSHEVRMITFRKDGG